MKNVAYLVFILLVIILLSSVNKYYNTDPNVINNSIIKKTSIKETEISRDDLANECNKTIESKILMYNSLLSQKEFLNAANSVRRCADLLNRDDLRNLVKNAEILYYKVDADNSTISDDKRLRAMHHLLAYYPKESAKYKDEIEKIESRINEDIAYFAWDYNEHEDQMTSKKIISANTFSINTINLDFPYRGQQHGKLTLRNHPRYGKDIIFRIEKGQIICDSFDECNVLVRFDDKEPQLYKAIGSDDNDFTILFIKNYQKFVENMLKSKKLLINVSIFGNAYNTFEFNTAGFDREKYKIKQDKSKKQ